MSPAVINETVRAARDFLKQHPKEMGKVVHGTVYNDRRHILSHAISKFLNWGRRRVKEVLASITEGIAISRIAHDRDLGRKKGKVNVNYPLKFT